MLPCALCWAHSVFFVRELDKNKPERVPSTWNVRRKTYTRVNNKIGRPRFRLLTTKGCFLSFMSANSNHGLQKSPKISPMPGAPGPVAFGQNLGPGVLPQAHYLIPGLGTQAQLPGLGYETRRFAFKMNKFCSKNNIRRCSKLVDCWFTPGCVINGT